MLKRDFICRFEIAEFRHVNSSASVSVRSAIIVGHTPSGGFATQVFLLPLW